MRVQSLKLRLSGPTGLLIAASMALLAGCANRDSITVGSVPDDYRIVEDDGSITDRDTLRANQLRAWAIIPRTNALTIDVTRVEVGCEGQCATVWTDQRWDRQMMGRDGRSEHNVVTTQRHEERWEVRGSRWIQTVIVELGGTTTVDGQPYS